MTQLNFSIIMEIVAFYIGVLVLLICLLRGLYRPAPRLVKFLRVEADDTFGYQLLWCVLERDLVTGITFVIDYGTTTDESDLTAIARQHGITLDLIQRKALAA